MIIMSSDETTVTATDITQQPAHEGDTEVSVRVMRSCVFLSLRGWHGIVAHVDISREDWAKLASSPPPVDDPAEDAEIERAIQEHARKGS